MLSQRQFAFGNVQIGTADSASPHAQQNLIRAGLRLGNVFKMKRLFRCVEDCSFHELISQV